MLPAEGVMHAAVVRYFKQLSKVGNRARQKKLSPERRREIAVAAANARWKKQPEHTAAGKGGRL
jgi:hypothetical protein